MISFTIPGTPQGKARARTVKNKYTGKTMSFTPDKSHNYEALIKMIAQKEIKELIDGPIKIKIVAAFGMPKSTSKKKEEEMRNGEIRPTKKPDWDNIGKIVCDALNGIAYKDDSQIVNASVSKKYSDNPHVYVEISKCLCGCISLKAKEV